MNRKVNYELRCPWCGRAAPPPAQIYFTTRECHCCGNRYGWSKESTIAEISGILALAVNIYLLINGYINFIVFVLLISVIIIFYPSKFFIKSYSRVGNDFYEAVEYTLRLDKNAVLKKKIIYPVCFGDEMTEPVFLSTESLKKKNNAVIAKLHTLPCARIPHIPMNCIVHVFLSDKEIYDGVLIASDGVSCK